MAKPPVDQADRAPIGRRLIDALALKDVSVRGHTLRMEGAYRADWLKSFMEDLERESAPHLRTLYAQLLAEPATPDNIKTLLKQAGSPTNQIDLIFNVLGYAIGLVTHIGTLTEPLLQSSVNAMWAAHATRPLTPDELAVIVTKGYMDVGDAAAQALQSGIDGTKFATLVAATGETPGPMDMLAMWRRGILTDARLDQGIAESRLKVEWSGALKEYAYGPPSAASAILGNVQNHLDEASARRIVQQNGIDPANYDWLYENAGRPPGAMQMVDLWNRGAVDEATVVQAIRESDIKDKYISAFLALRQHLLPQKTVVAGVHQGVISDEIALDHLLKLGISAQDAGFLIAEGHNEKVATHKQLSASQIETAYQDGSLTREQASTHLVTLGYIAADAEFILDLIDVQWQQALHNATVTRIKSLYLAHHIDRNTASADLDSAKVTPAHRDLYLQLWDVVRTTPTKTLTEAQAASAYKKGLITESAFRSRLVAMGYPTVDVDLLVELNPLPPPAAARR